jgi:hypothetical protein
LIMARKSFEKQVFDVAQSDIRVRVMDMAMRGFFFTLVALVRSLATDGRVVFGCGRVPCLADVVADSFCGMSVTEFKTHLETQCKTHLFSWDEAEQTLIYEPDEGLSARTKANRENGRKGGRPRKNTITERNDPAQRYITMSIQGGRDVSKHGTQSETHAPIAKLASTDTNQVKAKLRDPSKDEIDAVYQRIGPVAFDAAGFDPARDTLNWLAARQWAADGLAKGMTADEIERVVVAEVSRIAERQRSKGKPAPHLGYFGKAVAQAIATGTVPPVQQTPAQREADQAFVEAMQAWQRGGMKGPRPDLADYRAQVAA